MANAVINKEGMYNDDESRELNIDGDWVSLNHFRDDLYNKFNKQISLMLDAKKPRISYTDKGRLEPRRAYRYKFSDQLFKKNQSIPTGDTTVIFLIDGSGSMNSCNRIEKCSAICSAFAKSVNDVTKNQIKFEVFVKSAPALTDDNYGGSFVTLTEVLSNVGIRNQHNDFDKILKLNTSCPFKLEDSKYNEHSFTSEFAVLPALRKYMAKNLTTKNAIVVNLTDGEAYCNLGEEYRSFGSKENGAMRTKYLNSVPHVTVIVGGGIEEGEAKKTYGENRVTCEDGNFVPKLFSMFMKMLESQYE